MGLFPQPYYQLLIRDDLRYISGGELEPENPLARCLV